MSVLHSDNLLLFAWNLAWLLMLSVAILFALICRKHYERYKRYKALAEIENLLDQIANPELFQGVNFIFHERLRYFYERDNLDLMYAWAKKCKALSADARTIYCNNSARLGLFNRIPAYLASSNSSRICIALEVCGLADIREYIEEVGRYSWLPVYAPFACHALVRINFDEGMKSLFRAYGHQIISNSELLNICSEFSSMKLNAWAVESMHWPLPRVLNEYGAPS